MPFDGNKWSLRKFVPYRKMLAAVMAQYPDLQRISDGPNDTSKVRQALLFGGWFVLSTLPISLSLFPLPFSQNYQVPGYEGHVGFITSMSEHFCGSCNRLRLTADGNLKVWPSSCYLLLFLFSSAS